MLKRLDYNVLLKNKRVWICLIINILLIAFYTFLVNREYIYFTGWYYKKPFLGLFFSLLITAQSSFYNLYTNTYVMTRYKRSLDVYSMIIVSDLLVMIVFWVTNVLGCILVNVVTNVTVSSSFPFFILMFVWSLFCTCFKHFVFVLVENYNIANIIVIVILLILKIVTDIFFSTYFGIGALIGSVIMIFYVLETIKKDEYLIRGGDEK